MTDVNTLHEQAMLFADQAETAKRSGLTDEAKAFSRQALELERSAAMALISAFESEPTRSVLFRSAAALAIDAGDPQAAEQMIGLGLGGNPPAEISSELHDLMEHITFLRHLELRGIELEPEEVQFSIAGPAVDFGMASSDDFVGRIKVFEKWLKSTVDRFAERGQWGLERLTSIRRGLGVYMSIPRPASFAISLRVGKPAGQQTFRFDSFESGLIDEILDEIELINEGKEDELAARVGGEVAARKVIGFAKAMAPQRGGVDTVGFTTYREGKERKVAFRRERSEIKFRRQGTKVFLPPNFDLVTPLSTQEMQVEAAAPANELRADLVRVQGRLKFADGTGGQSVLKLIASDGQVFTIFIDSDSMDAIVRPHWADEVIVVGHSTPKGIEFEDIELPPA